MIDQQTVEMLLVGVWDTLYMTLVATFFSYVFGLVMGVVLVVCRKDGGVLDEIPSAYKDIDTVMEHQSDLARIVHRFRQVLCVKG